MWRARGGIPGTGGSGKEGAGPGRGGGDKSEEPVTEAEEGVMCPKRARRALLPGREKAITGLDWPDVVGRSVRKRPGGTNGDIGGGEAGMVGESSGGTMVNRQ